MDLQVKNNYWTFNLSPFIFQVKNINFHYLTTWWGISLCIIFFGGGYLLLQKFVQNPKKRDPIQAALIYLFITLIVLFGLNKMQINWGLRWYSSMYLLGFLTFYLCCLYWIKKKTILLTEHLLATLIAFVIFGMLLGARLAYVFIYNFDYYKLHPLEALATWEGGLSFHGAFVGIVIALILFSKKYKIIWAN